MPTATDVIQIGLVGEALENGPALVFVADDEMKYVAVNRLAAETLGYTREELLRLQVTDVARAATATDEFRAMIRRRGLTGSAVLTCKDGTELVFHYQAARTRIAALTFFVSVGFVDAG